MSVSVLSFLPTGSCFTDADSVSGTKDVDRYCFFCFSLAIQGKTFDTAVTSLRSDKAVLAGTLVAHRFGTY